MKKTVFIIINILFHLAANAQFASTNHIASSRMLDAVDRAQVSVQTFDGLGSLVQIATNSRGWLTSISNKCFTEHLDGGYVIFTSAGPHYHYYMKDHLGSNRAVLDDSGEILQLVHYYPFGGIFADAGISHEAQEYLYCGKELEPMHGLATYDFGARQYYNALPLWDRMDPLCEKYPELSPYVFCGNNPIKNYDDTGKDFKVIIDFKVITITAKIYSMDEDYMDAQSAAEWINDQSGKYVWSYKDGEETKELPINFDITVEKVTKWHGNKMVSLQNAIKNEKEDYNKNTFSEIETFEDANTNGTTLAGKVIKVKQMEDIQQTIIHEFGHALSMSHAEFGIMTIEHDNQNRNLNFIEKNIYDMMCRAFNHDYRSISVVAKNDEMKNIGIGTLYNFTNIDSKALKRGYVKKSMK